MANHYGAVAVGGLTGATQASRYVGATTSGPPTSGTFAVGDHVIDRTAGVWVCTAAGTPGTWVMLGAVLSTTLSGFPAAAASNSGQIAFASDVSGGTLYRSNGTSWLPLAAPLGSAKGDILCASGASAAGRLAVGTAGQLLMPSTGATFGLAWTTNPYVGSIAPTGAIAETMPRAVATSNTLTANATGVLRMVGIWLPINTVVTSISVMTGTTALATGTHSWGALYDSSRNLLRQSTDVTSPVAAAQTIVTFTLSSTFTTTYSGLHYLGLMWTATTMPTYTGSNGTSAMSALAPILAGTSSSGLTATAPNPAAAITGTGVIPYCYVS